MIADAGYFILYLIYGLVFFLIGAAITSRDLSFSDLKVSRILWIFALFAYVHGVNEWFVLFLNMNHQHVQGNLYAYLMTGQLLLLWLSFAFLFWFGLELLLLNRSHKRYGILIALLVALIILGPPVAALLLRNYGFFDLFLRNFVALPGAVISGWGLIRYGMTKEIYNRRGGKNLAFAGYAILLYGFFAGVLPSGINLAGIPVELFRAVSAFLILHCIMRALKIFDDERKHMIEESLKRFTQSEKMVSLGKLSAGIAHEINNPLSNVLLNVETMEKELRQSEKLDSRSQDRIDAIKRNLDRAAKIAGELLFFSHNRDAELMPFNLNEVIHKTFRLIGSRQELYDFKLKLGEIPEISGIPWKIEEVLLNLLMNAMEALPPGGVIEVTTGVEGDKLCCTVRDHGSGISEEDLRFVLDPFFTTKEPGKGTGLGLSICFGIMELHGGEIILSSTLGEGTTVRLLFPLPGDSVQ
jgi:signal transduction histidine kinase